jgi:hypothetical protein
MQTRLSSHLQGSAADTGVGNNETRIPGECRIDIRLRCESASEAFALTSERPIAPDGGLDIAAYNDKLAQFGHVK